MIAAADVTDEMIQKLIRTLPAEERTVESAMMLLAAQGKSPGPEYQLPTTEQKMRARAWCALMLNTIAAKESLS